MEKSKFSEKTHGTELDERQLNAKTGGTELDERKLNAKTRGTELDELKFVETSGKHAIVRRTVKLSNKYQCNPLIPSLKETAAATQARDKNGETNGDRPIP
eukprot:gb/GECG01005650.1/.p1 GENE.gb/GECG01005650.1/~~gb/GECG01005650.1/.p1  ORF type:complete len:101 (+),score=16.96 gb/GECG01005650.1/:1-303(+)